MKFLQLHRMLRHHRALAIRRDPMYNTNKAAQVLLGVFMSLICLYLMGFSILLSMSAIHSRVLSSPQFLIACMPFILVIDFWGRFLLQQTPAQLIKPYVLLPIPRYACIDSFVLNSLFSWGNMIWFILFIPYCIMAVVFSYGILTTLLLLLSCYVMILINSQYYSIIRTLVSRKAIWWIVPFVVILLMVLPMIWHGSKPKLLVYAACGNGLTDNSPWLLLICLALLGIFLILNRSIQYKEIWNELGKTAQSSSVKTAKLSFLDKWGMYGEYIRLEIRLLFRNKTPRKKLINIIIAISIIDILFSFESGIFGDYGNIFWCMYNYSVMAGTLLITIMSFEGNYIDILFVKKENILYLLKAKYIFYSLFLFIPLVLMLLPMILAHWSLQMIIACGVFIAGFGNFLTMQMAVYNNKCLPLNSNATHSVIADNKTIQMVYNMVALTLPMGIAIGLIFIFSETVAYWIIFLVGLAFVITSPIWIRNIYNRMLQRKYINLEAFHA